jgi:signal transduction histidine kinase
MSCRRSMTATAPPELGKLGFQLDHAAAEVSGALDDLRELARGIHPAVLGDGGLRPALGALARRSPLTLTFAQRGVCPSMLRSAPTMSWLRR